MPFGLHSAPATFQRALHQVIGPDLETNSFAYLSDIVVVSKTFEEHCQHLGKVFQRLKDANLKINAEKLEFFKSEIKYLGHVISKDGVHTNSDKIAAIQGLLPPENLRQLCRCLGITSRY